MKAKVLVIDDEKLIGWSLKQDLTREGYEVFTAQTAREGESLFESEQPDAVLLDIRLPDGDGREMLHQFRKKDPFAACLMITANDDIRSAVQCMQSGAFTYLHKPFNFDEIKVNLEKAIESRRLRQKVAAWQHEERGKYDFGSIVCESVKMKAVLDLIRRIVDSDASTVLIEGESGTGKDLVAHSLHYGSRRAEKPFVSLNCAAIPATLLESELFGHEKGAFTDARESKRGLVEEASGGTLFLDEIGDMSRELQAKLLHLIDQKKFRKVGGVRELSADIRIVAATNKELKKEVSEGRFREDLYYRLHVIPIYLAPLRERREDIPSLVAYFIGLFNREFRKIIRGVDPRAMEILLQYRWPGNVRELKNVIERAMILNNEELIRPEHLPSEIDCNCALKECHRPSGAENLSSQEVPRCLTGFHLEEIEKQVIQMTIRASEGNQSKAARMLGIGRDALRYKMQKYGFMKDSDPELSEISQS